jgi:hypothetical protein
MNTPQLNNKRVRLAGKDCHRIGLVTHTNDSLVAVRWCDDSDAHEPVPRQYKRLVVLEITVGATVVLGTLRPLDTLSPSSTFFGVVTTMTSSVLPAEDALCVVHWDDDHKSTVPATQLMDVEWIAPFSVADVGYHEWIRLFEEKRYVDLRKSSVTDSVTIKFACKRNSADHRNRLCSCGTRTSNAKRSHHVQSSCMCSFRIIITDNMVTFSGRHTHVPGKLVYDDC